VTTLQPAPPTHADVLITLGGALFTLGVALGFVIAFLISRWLDHRDNWIVPRIPHDETSPVRPRVRRGWIWRDAGDSTPAHAREYAAQLLAAADAAEATGPEEA
jgi:hypothetical protein